MFTLIIKYNNIVLQEISLNIETKYTLGRDKKNNIVLPEKPGISRKHLILFYSEQQEWVVQNLSKTDTLHINGEPTPEGIVPIDSIFTSQNFEFTLLCAKQPQLYTDTQQPHDTNSPQPPTSNTNTQPLPLNTSDNPQSTEENIDSNSNNNQQITPFEPNDKTRILDTSQGEFMVSAYLKVSYGDVTSIDIFELKQNKKQWICGRDNTADIIINNPNISRNHFKITKKNRKYYIIDLNSANGTFVNNKELSSKTTHHIYSLDVIEILNIEIIFEIKNPNLEKSLATLTLPEPTIQAVSNVPSVVHNNGTLPTPFPANLPSVIIEESPQHFANASFIKKHKKRLVMYGTVMVLIAAGFLFSKTPPEKKQTPKIHIAKELLGFSPQERQLIKDIYKNAQILYYTGKFEYCKSELQKLHKYINSYEKSKVLNVACAQAAENQKKIHEISQQKHKAAQTEKFILKTINNCTKKFKTFTVKYELMSCLAPAVELSPADNRINVLTERFDAIEMEKKEIITSRIQRKNFIKSIASKYYYAKSLRTKGKIIKAMSAYKVFIKLSNHKELKTKQSYARRELATMTKNFHLKNKNMEQNCTQPFNNKEFKKAYYACVIARDKIPPPNNQKVINLILQSKQHLYIKMKPLYETANLHESVGNVSVAQQNWRMITSTDVDTGVYYLRAMQKLGKYTR